MAEEVFLDEGGVRISTSKAQIGGVTYPTNGITSVRNGIEAPGIGLPLILGVPGLLGLLCSGLMLYGASLPPPDGMVRDPSGALTALPCLGISALFVLGAMVVVLSSSTRYLVIIGTAGGDKRALITRDRPFAVRVREALEEAITRRG